MAIKDLRLGVSAISDEVYVGKLNKAGNMWSGEKKNITSDFHRCITQMYGGYSVIITSADKKWKLTCEEIKDDISDEEDETRL